MKDIVIVGAGKIGSMIAELLGGSGDYSVTVVDRSQHQLERLETAAPIAKIAADITQGDALRKILTGKFAVLSAAPYHATRTIAEAAKAAGAHYLDLTEDVASTRAVKQLAEGARTAFIPQCGLAPGFITIVASDLASRFDQLQDVRMRVGALPKFPSNALNYNLTWSTDGVINEYCDSCAKPSLSRNWKSSLSTAFCTRHSTPQAASALFAKPSPAGCATSTTARSVIPATQRS